MLYNKYTDDKNKETIISYLPEDLEDLKKTSFKSLDSKIYYNDSYLALTGEPLFENSDDVNYDFNKLSPTFIKNLIGENELLENELLKSYDKTEGKYGLIDLDKITKGSLNELVNVNYKTLAKKILKHNPEAKLWFTLPGNMNFLPLAKQFIEPYKLYVIDGTEKMMKELETELGMKNIWENNVRGFNFGYENMTDYEYHNFDYNFVEHYENRTIGEDLALTEGARRNKVLELSVAMSDYVHSKGKEFLWIPHYQNIGQSSGRPFYDDIILSLITNSTDIFDYVTIQPNAFWASEVHKQTGQINNKNNIEIVKKNIDNNAVFSYRYDRNKKYLEPGEDDVEMIIADKYNSLELANLRVKNDFTTKVNNGSKTSKTIIGVEYELDANIIQSQYKNDYDKYNVFNQYKEIPYTIYADHPGQILNFLEVNKEVQRLLKLNDQ